MVVDDSSYHSLGKLLEGNWLPTRDKTYEAERCQNRDDTDAISGSVIEPYLALR